LGFNKNAALEEIFFKLCKAGVPFVLELNFDSGGMMVASETSGSYHRSGVFCCQERRRWEIPCEGRKIESEHEGLEVRYIATLISTSWSGATEIDIEVGVGRGDCDSEDGTFDFYA